MNAPAFDYLVEFPLVLWNQAFDNFPVRIAVHVYIRIVTAKSTGKEEYCRTHDQRT